MSKKCPSCQVGNIVEELVGTETNRTCDECGCVVEDSSLQQETFVFQEGYGLSTEGSFEKKYGVSIGGRPCTTQLHKEMMKKIKDYTADFPNSQTLCEAASEMYTRVTRSSYLRHMAETKNLVAVACLVIILRRHNHYVLVHEVCDKFAVSGSRICSVMAEVKKVEEIECPSVPTEAIVDAVLREYLSADEAQRLRKITLQVYLLFDELLLSAHRPRQAVGVCALYFAILSQGKTLKRPMTVQGFCKKYNVKAYNALKDVVPVAWDRLVILANRLPWVNAPVPKNKVHIYINDIVKSKLSLKSRDSTQEVNHQPESRKRPSSELIEVKKEVGTAEQSTISDQMKLELPVCEIKRLKRQHVEVLQPDPTNVSRSEIITEDEFADDDINNYIRSSEEVSLVQKIKEKLTESKYTV